MTARFPAVFIGGITVDTIARVPDFPEPDQRMVADQIMTADGGAAATAAVVASRLGVAGIAFAGVVGDDAEADRALAALEDEGIDTSLVERRAAAQTAQSIVVACSRRATRAIINRPAPLISAEGLARALEAAADIVHLDHVGWAACGRDGVTPQSDGRRVSLDLGYDVPGPSLRGVDLYVPSIELLRSQHGERTVGDLLDLVRAEGVSRVIATSGSDGADGADTATPHHHEPARHVDVVSTLGAGDVYHGATVAALSRGLTLDRMMRLAADTAAQSCTALDGRSAVTRNPPRPG